MRIGHGYDVHRFKAGRKCVICGVEIPFEFGLLGHSDADVAVHALIDAMLGAAAMGDIGRMFPDNDPEYEGESSIYLLKQVKARVLKKGYVVSNADITVIAQRPKLLPYLDRMAETIASALGIDRDRINVKATTEEGLGFTGEMKGIAAHSVVLLEKAQ